MNAKLSPDSSCSRARANPQSCLSRASLALSLLAWVPSHGRAQTRFGQYDVRSAFHVRKSENRNQVHYGVHLDARCRPQGEEPLYAYWQEREEGEDVVLPLNALDRRAYGIYRQQLDLVQARSGRVRLWLEAAKDREIRVESYRDANYRCQARVLTRIADESRAELDFIYVKIGQLTRIEYVELRGRTLGGRAVQERIEP